MFPKRLISVTAGDTSAVQKALYTPSFVHTVLGTAETSEILGAGHFQLHCEPSPALRREQQSHITTQSMIYFLIISLRASCF